MGKRRLGIDIRDDYGRLIPPPEGEAATLRQGGDDFGHGAPSTSRSGPWRCSPARSRWRRTGRRRCTLDLPDFAGELRLMAVAWAGDRIGAAAKPLTVRDPVVAEALLPRFLAPGDEARLPVLLHNLDLPAGEVTATLSAEGAIALAGPARLAATLAPGARALPASAIRATAAGQGVLRLAITGPDGFSATREARITVRSSRPVTTEVAAQEIPPGAERPLAAAISAAGSPASWLASASFGGPVRYDSAGMLRQLELYPYGCLEQSASQLLAFAADAGASADGRREARRGARLQRAAEAVLGKQRFDGSFGLWSAQGEARHWTGAYADRGPAARPHRRRRHPRGGAGPGAAGDRRAGRGRLPRQPGGIRRPGLSAACAVPGRQAAAGRGAAAAGAAGRPADAAGQGAARRRLRPGRRPAAGRAGLRRARSPRRRGRPGSTTTAARRGMRWRSRCC